MKKNIILGLASGYSFYDLKPFCTSLRKTNYDGDVVFFVNNISKNDTILLKNYGVIVIPFQNKMPFCPENIELNSYISEDFSNAIDKAKKFDEKPKFLTRLTTIESHDKGRFCNIRTNVS